MQDAFFKACTNGADPEEILWYLRNPYVDPAAEYSASIFRAASAGHTKVVGMLLADHRADPSAMNNSTIRWAADAGHADVVRLLLADPRVDPSGHNNEAVWMAAAKGHEEVLRELLADDRVNALDAIKCAEKRCLCVLAIDKRFGVEQQRDEYMTYRPEIVQQYDIAVAQCYAMAWFAKQQNTWIDLVEPVAKRLKAGCF